MQYLYLFFILFHLLFALLPLHLRAENIVLYSRKVLRRHPECKPQGFWDFITFRYCLRCPRANNITVFLYRANLAALCFLVPLAAAAVVFAAVPIDFDRALPGALRWLPFLPLAVSLAFGILGCIGAEPQLGLKYYLRRWILADLVEVVICILIYMLCK